MPVAEGNGTRVTNTQLYNALGGLEKLFRSELRRVEEKVDSLGNDIRERRTAHRAWFPPLIAALVSAGIALPVALFH